VVRGRNSKLWKKHPHQIIFITIETYKAMLKLMPGNKKKIQECKYVRTISIDKALGFKS
jgi:hypothetical protein